MEKSIFNYFPRIVYTYGTTYADGVLLQYFFKPVCANFLPCFTSGSFWKNNCRTVMLYALPLIAGIACFGFAIN
jgi:hypothetical protein